MVSTLSELVSRVWTMRMKTSKELARASTVSLQDVFGVLRYKTRIERNHNVRHIGSIVSS